MIWSSYTINYISPMNNILHCFNEVHCQHFSSNYTFGCSTLRKLLILLGPPSKSVRGSSLRTLHIFLHSSISCFRLCSFVCIHLSKGWEDNSWFSITGEHWLDLTVAPCCGEKGAEVGGMSGWYCNFSSRGECRQGSLRCGEEESGVEGVRGGVIGVASDEQAGPSNRVKSKTGVKE